MAHWRHVCKLRRRRRSRREARQDVRAYKKEMKRLGRCMDDVMDAWDDLVIALRSDSEMPESLALSVADHLEVFAMALHDLNDEWEDGVED